MLQLLRSPSLSRCTTRRDSTAPVRAPHRTTLLLRTHRTTFHGESSTPRKKRNPGPSTSVDKPRLPVSSSHHVARNCSSLSHCACVPHFPVRRLLSARATDPPHLSSLVLHASPCVCVCVCVCVSAAMRTERELRALYRRIDALDVDMREIIIAYAIGRIVLNTAFDLHLRLEHEVVHTALVRGLLLMCKPCAVELAMDYSRRCISDTRRILRQLNWDYLRYLTNAATQIDAVEEWLRHPSAVQDTLIFARLEVWGDITVLEVQWSDNATPCKVVEIRYSFRQHTGGVVVNSSHLTFPSDDAPGVSLEMPTRDTVRCMRDLATALFSADTLLQTSSASIDAYTSASMDAHNVDKFLLATCLLMSYDDWCRVGSHRQPAYQYSACEWVYGL